MSNKKSISNSFSVSTIEDGEQGKRGRFYYYAGEFDSTNDDDTFVINDAQAPFFKHIESGQTRYHVFNPDGNPDHDLTMEEMWAISNNWNNRPWEAMTNDFKYLITEAIFSNFAHFGSAIISGDWMISQYGILYDASNNATSINSDEASVTIDEKIYNKDNAFTKFDPTSPNEPKSNVVNFVPNYSLDMKRGWSYQNVSEVRGVFRSTGKNGSSTYLSAASLLFGFRDADIFNISCEGSGSSRNVKMQIGAGESGMTYIEIESRGTFQNTTTSLLKITNLEAGTNVPQIVIHKGGIAMTNMGGTILKSKTWDELLS